MDSSDDAAAQARFEQSLAALHAAEPPRVPIQPVIQWIVINSDGQHVDMLSGNRIIEPPIPPTPPAPPKIHRTHTKGTGGQCGVCLDDMMASEETTPLKCAHVFHSKCVDNWLDMNHTCPTCRAVEDAPKEEEDAYGGTRIDRFMERSDVMDRLVAIAAELGYESDRSEEERSVRSGYADRIFAATRTNGEEEEDPATRSRLILSQLHQDERGTH